MGNTIHEKLMRKIEAGQLAMKPRWHFVLRGTVIGLGMAIVVLVAVFLSGMLTLALRASGMLVMPVFGWRGLMEFLRVFPWLVTLLVAAFLLGVELYARKYSFSYKWPVAGSIAVVFVIIGAAGFIVGHYLQHGCPGRGTAVGTALGQMRAAVVHRPDMIHIGSVLEVRESGFDLEVLEVRVPVLVSDDTRGLPVERLTAGDAVVVFGPEDDGVIHALGWRRNDGTMPPPVSGCDMDAVPGHGLFRPQPNVMFEAPQP